ncbi:hypothetical protein WJX72_000942 [[Myrmecia] bisecta]|uniref:Fungal lipase-type domain-containing protein n=1 Tax=[Myrmecia] bisecta TaxID=41462 RepID=A0AAW1QPL8_9CHLO
MPGERDLQAEELLHSSSDQSSYAYWYADSRAFNPFRDVVVRLETVGEKQVRVIVVVVRSTVALAVVLLALETALKYLKDNDWWLRSRAPQLWNLVLGAICLAASCSMLLHLVARLIGVRRAGKRWTRRRKYIVTLHTMELAAQGVNNLMWVTANAYVYAGKCRWFDPLVHWCAFISWTCWNTILLIFITEAHANNPWRHRVWQKRRSGSDRGPQAGHDHQPHHHQADEKSMVRDSAQPQQANADVDSVSWESDQPQPKRDVDEDSVFWDSQPPQSKQVHQTVMDAPTTHHLPKFVVWGAFEAINIAVLVLHTGRYESVQALRNEQLANAPRCEAQAYSCRLDGLSLRLIAALMGIFFLYQAIWVWYMVRAFQLLRRMPYADYKLANIHLAIELRTRLYTIAVFFVSLLLLFWLRFNSCASYIQSWLGFGPLMMVATTLSVTQCYMFEPKDPDLALPVLTVWLQDFAWTEEDKPRKLAARLAMLPICPAILDEPLFCFETAVKMFYWSALVYRYQEPPPGHHPHMSTDTALRMYSLQHLQCFWEKKEDTKVLVGWSDSLVVLAFRGTASLANVLADIQMWRSPYPPGKQSCCVRPLVHSGFKRSWLANGLRDKVCQHVADITRAAACARRDVQVIVTGHSLGGALATLAAFDIMRGCPWLSKKAVSCYTFGAPRTGNHAFAAEYNATVPDTWHVINDQDAVARGGKFVWLYKRPGQRVLIDAAGNIVVRPVFVELTVQQLPLRRSIGQHMLVAYQRSLLAICGAHLNSKRWRPVMQAFERILEQVAAHTAPSREEDEDLEALERLGRFGLLAAAVGGKVHRGFNEVRNQLDPGANGSAAPDIEDGRRASPREGQGSGGLADIRVDDAAAPDEPSSPPGHLHFRELPWQPPHVQGLSDPSPTALPGSLSSGSSLSSSSDPPHTPGTLYGFLAQLRDQGELTPEIIHLPMPPRTDRQREGVGPPLPPLLIAINAARKTVNTTRAQPAPKTVN